MAKPRVQAFAVESKLAYGQRLDLEVTVINPGPKPIQVMVERVNVAKAATGHIHVFVGQPPQPEGGCYYAYWLPKLRRLNPSMRTVLPVAVGLPLREGYIDADGRYAEREVVLSGSVSVSVFVGYLETPVKPKSNDPWGEFLAAQKIGSAKPILIDVAAPGP